MINVKIHESADVQSESIGPGTTIWQSVVILPDARIGADVNICAHCFVENDVVIGDRVIVKTGLQLWDIGGAVILPGLKIGANAMVGAVAVVARYVAHGAIVVGNKTCIAGYAEGRA